ncbi:MAG: 8-oxo-dGTP diphosphatase MutT [Pseudomonadota bacterium]
MTGAGYDAEANESPTPVVVAVAVIRNQRGEVLISKRSIDKHQGGLWEFPGGKCEYGETLDRALTRELREELGIEVEASSELFQIEHDYGDKKVVLRVCEVTRSSGTPVSREGQPIRWVTMEALASFEFPAATGPILDFLSRA